MILSEYIRPIGSYALIKRTNDPQETESGFWLPPPRFPETVATGVVVAISKAYVTDGGVEVPHRVAVGDEVLYQGPTAHRVEQARISPIERHEVGGELLDFVDERYIWGIVVDE